MIDKIAPLNSTILTNHFRCAKVKNFICSLLFMLLSFRAYSIELEIVTTDFPPYQIQNGEKVTGMAVEMVQEVVKNSGHKGTISVYPWARAYQIAQKNPNAIIFSIARTPEREKLFKWVGTMVPFNVYFWKLAERKDIQLKTMDDAKKYLSGGVFNDIKAQYLTTHGFVEGKNLEMVRNDELNIHKLFGNHIDLIPFDENSFPWKVARAGHDIRKITKLLRIDGLATDLYIAASLNTPDSVVNDLRKFATIILNVMRL